MHGPCSVSEPDTGALLLDPRSVFVSAASGLLLEPAPLEQPAPETSSRNAAIG